MTYWKRPRHWERLKTKGEVGGRGRDGWMASRLSGRESEQTPGDSEGQGSLACYSPWGHKESDTIQWVNNNQLLFVTFERKLRVHLIQRPLYLGGGSQTHAPAFTMVQVPSRQAPSWLWPMGSTGWTLESRRKGEVRVLLLTFYGSRRSPLWGSSPNNTSLHGPSSLREAPEQLQHWPEWPSFWVLKPPAFPFVPLVLWVMLVFHSSLQLPYWPT